LLLEVAAQVVDRGLVLGTSSSCLGLTQVKPTTLPTELMRRASGHVPL